MTYPLLDAELARDALAAAGYRASAEGLVVERRKERWLARLADGNLAWFAATTLGASQLALERRVLRLLASRCRFRAPRLVFEAPDGRFDVRVPVPGAARPWELYARLREDPGLATRLGAALGAVLAHQHTQISARDVRAWLPAQPSWPLQRAEIEQRLPRVTDDRELRRAALELFARYEAQPVADGERVLAHCDLGLHNIAVDPQSYALQGVFDYQGAAWADRHHDFRYLVFDYEDFTLLDAAAAAYQAGGAGAIERERVLLYNATCAVSYLADRAGTAPDARPAGRTLEEDLRWVGLALSWVAR